jgi:hypothetical protein
VRASEGTQINNIYPDAVRVRVYGAVPVVAAVLPCWETVSFGLQQHIKRWNSVRRMGFWLSARFSAAEGREMGRVT